MKSVWVVETTDDNGDPHTWGPYTERQAKRLAEKIMTADDEDSGIERAVAYPLGRWEDE